MNATYGINAVVVSMLTEAHMRMWASGITVLRLPYRSKVYRV